MTKSVLYYTLLDMRLFYFFVTICLSTLFLTACEKITTTTSDVNASATHSWIKESYSAESKQEQNAALLHAAACYIQKNQLQVAHKIILSLPTDLPSELNRKRQWAMAELLIANKKPLSAKLILDEIKRNYTALSRVEYTQQHTLMSQVLWQLGDIDAAIAESDKLLPVKKRQRIALSIWEELRKIPVTAQREIRGRTQKTNTLGWLDFSILFSEQNKTPWTLQPSLAAWLTHYPYHTAETLINKSSLLGKALHPLEKLIVLLPLSGPYHAAGKAVQQGVLAAYKSAEKAHIDHPQLEFWDTGREDLFPDMLKSILLCPPHSAIVGPLLPKNIQKILSSYQDNTPSFSQTSPRWLLLNTTKQLLPPNSYISSLSSRLEIEAITQRAHKTPTQKALLLVPDSPQGKEQAQYFTQLWSAQGGMSDSCFYDPNSTLSVQLSRCMQIKASSLRAQKLTQSLQISLRAVARRRQDIDLFFISAPPALAKQIRPLLNYFYAGKIPIYSLSSVFSGNPNTEQNKDLEGILFPAKYNIEKTTPNAPLVQSALSYLYAEESTTLPAQNTFSQLGIDLYWASTAFTTWSLFDHAIALPGARGELLLTKNALLLAPRWYQFQANSVELVESDS